MKLTKEQLIDAHEQGLLINTRNGNIKIVTILGDVYGVNHCDTNSKLVKFWMFENFERNQATIEQPKPKYNGRAVKCDTVEQWQWIHDKLLPNMDYSIVEQFNNGINHFNISGKLVGKENYYKERNYEIISFSQYCTENGINEPKWIQGFEVGKDYNDVVMVSDSHLRINTSFPNVSMRILKEVREDSDYPFIMHDNSMFAYARYPRKDEINEIKFVG